MRGPEEGINAEAQSSSSGEGGSGGNEGRDPCSSPPCKRLKQAVLSFQSTTSTSRSNSPPLSSPSPPKDSSGIPKEVIVIAENRAPNCGGLVTAAPSPPEKGRIKPQSSCMEHTSTTEDEKDEEKQPNTTEPNDKLNDSSESNNQETICSPKQTSPNNAKTPLRPTSAEKKKYKEEIQRLKEERQKLKEEKERQRMEAKVQKEKERLEAKQKKEQERLEKQAEKEKKEKERLEKKQREEREKQEKKEKKEEERRKKEEEVNAKLEEKRKKEEEKKQQEEELQRKRKQASLSFKNFFTKTTNTPPKTLPKAVLKFEPFEIKPHMSLAPVLRKQLSKESEQKLDELMHKQEEYTLYMKELQKQKPLPPYRKERRRTIASKSSKQTEQPSEKNEKKDQNDAIEISDDESSDVESVVEIQQEEKKRMKVIFLKFHENNRPPYYGTHRKKSKKISPKNPLKKDEGLLNYEVDSDDEWEEEEPGESLSDDSDGDDDEADDGGDEEDDGFMVPHGYLSDDEGIDADDEENEVDSTSKQEQQLAKVKAWEAELKRKCKAKKPVCIGCVWPDDKNINEMLQQFQACILVDEPPIAIRTTSSTSVDSSHSMNEITTATPDSVYKGGMYVPEEAMPDLITLIHRSTAGVAKLMDYFKEHWSKKCENTKAHSLLAGKGHISKRQLEAKIKAIATKERRNDKPRWYVHGYILAAYGLTRLGTVDNEQGTPIGKSCSPQVSNAGIKVFTKSVSPSINQSQNAISQMMTSPHLQTGNSSTQDKQQYITLSVQSVNSMQVLPVHAQIEHSSVTPVVKRVVLQPVSKVEGAVVTEEDQPNLQGSSVGHGAQARNPKESSVTPVVKRRVLLQPVSKAEGAVVTKEDQPNLQGSSVGHGTQAQNPKVSSVTPVAKRRVILQPVSKAEVGAIVAKENLPNQQTCSTAQTTQVQNNKLFSVIPVVKQRAVLQPIAKPDIGGISAKENQPNPSPEQSCNAVDSSSGCSATSINTTIPIKTQGISPSDGLMNSSAASTVTSSPSTSPNDTGCISSAVKRTASSPVGTDRVAKVPRKSEESVEIHQDVNTPFAVATENVVDVTNRPQGTLGFSQNPKQPQESSRNSTSETAKLENSSKEITECTLVINSVCKKDGLQPMEIEIIKA